MVKMKTENMILAFVGLQTQELSQVKSETAPPTKGKERAKKEAHLISKRLQRRLVSDNHNMSRSLPLLPTRILRACIEAFSGFSHVYHPYGLTNTLPFQCYILANGSTVGTVGRKHIPRTGDRVRGF